MEKIITLKSCNPQEYPDLEIRCRVLQNDEIGEYLSQIPESKKSIGTKSASAPVSARVGVPGEEVTTTLITYIDSRAYILGEETGTVKERDGLIDIVVTNISSTSNERYIVKAKKFRETYEPSETELLFFPIKDERELTEVPENLIIMTAWGSEAICLKGSYIVTYDAASNDYNTLERGAAEKTYTITPKKTKSKVLKKITE